jgi:hypothetical protein
VDTSAQRVFGKFDVGLQGDNASGGVSFRLFKIIL